MQHKTSFILAALLIGGCANTGLKLSSAGEKVRVLDPDEVSSCREMAKVNAATTRVIMGVERPDATIAKELRIVARNRAAKLGGDTIVPLTIVEDGAQAFVVYKCINPDG